MSKRHAIKVAEGNSTILGDTSILENMMKLSLSVKMKSNEEKEAKKERVQR